MLILKRNLFYNKLDCTFKNVIISYPYSKMCFLEFCDSSSKWNFGLTFENISLRYIQFLNHHVNNILTLYIRSVYNY